MAKHAMLGFEPDLMTDRLIALLIAEGGAAVDDPRVRIWKSAPSDEHERERRWHHAWLLGMDHVSQHGVQQGGPLCDSYPCRVSGLSAAIVEISTYWAESTDSRGLIAATDEITSYLNKPANGFPALLRFIEQNQTVTPSLSRVAKAAAEARHRADALAEALMSAQALLLTHIESPQFRQAASGRAAERLLTAVYQHLRHAGGFSFRELAMIETEPDVSPMPDATSDRATQAFASRIEAIEKRVASEDVRTWHPYVRPQTAEPTTPASFVG